MVIAGGTALVGRVAYCRSVSQNVALRLARLAGKTATIEAIEEDYEGRVYVAVTVDDDVRGLGGLAIAGSIAGAIGTLITYLVSTAVARRWPA
ncbi:MAG: hypothetical protein WDZ59_11060 [Pirellulales bacterium]